MNLNLINKLILAYTKLLLHTQELEKQVEEQAAEIARLKVQEKENTSLFQKIADNTPAMIYILDLKQGRNIYLNRYGREFFGFPTVQMQEMGKEFLGEYFRHSQNENINLVKEKFSHNKNNQEFEQLNKKFMVTNQDNQVWEEELHLKNAQGKWHYFQNQEVIFMQNAEGIPEQILGLAIDITQEKQAEANRQELLVTQKETLIAKNRFLSMISHELRTPLTTILITVQSLLTFYHQWSEKKHLLKLAQVELAAQKMKVLIEDILTINRLEAEKISCNPEPCNLKQFCDDLVKQLKVNTNNQYTFDFVSQGECNRICLDQKIIDSILTNLLSNASKYSPDGSLIELSVNCKPREVTFVIQDRGIGIDKSDLDRIFEPFYRGANTSNIIGSGLGLTVVKKFVDLHGGTIRITSDRGVGTTVTVILPVK